MVADALDEGRHARALRAGQPLDAVAVGADRDHLGAVRRVGAGVEQGLQVGAGAGDEDDETRWHGADSSADSSGVRAYPGLPGVGVAQRAAMPQGRRHAAEETAETEGDDRVHHHLADQR